jgi:hypothetical protein
MPDAPARPNGSQPEFPQTLTDRVLARVADASFALDRRATATRPKAQRRSRVARPSPESTASKTTEQLREDRSLRRVFREMGVSYRRYRKQTGEPVTPGLRDAAYKFRADPSLTSLVAVAAFLDELDLLS